mgnify:CR=1 FL=1
MVIGRPGRPGPVVALLEVLPRARARRDRVGNATIKLTEAERTGVKVIEATDVSYAWPDGKVVIRDFSTVIQRGEKIGILGPNGAMPQGQGRQAAPGVWISGE